jgi:hypothetical protein
MYEVVRNYKIKNILPHIFQKYFITELRTCGNVIYGAGVFYHKQVKITNTYLKSTQWPMTYLHVKSNIHKTVHILFST